MPSPECKIDWGGGVFQIQDQYYSIAVAVILDGNRHTCNLQNR